MRFSIGVLLCLKESGLRLNANKCHFAKSHVEFLGHSWSAAGVTPDAGKLDAISQASRRVQLRSFLGLASYLGSHAVPHFSTDHGSPFAMALLPNLLRVEPQLFNS